MSAQPIRIAIVEDTREIREGLCLMLSNASGFHCIASCGSAEEALVELPTHPVGVVLMDIGLPGMSGIDCIRQLKKLMPNTEIMMLTVFEDPERIFQSLAAGATGYLIKKTPPNRLLAAISDLHQGGSPVSNQIARRVLQAFRKNESGETSASMLSEREREILDCLGHGLLYKEIGTKLGISTETVRTHVRNIYKKLQVRTRAEALEKVRAK
jgi:DNA-binding NarL/FixJ family response regulator